VSKLRDKLLKRHRKQKRLALKATAREIGQIGGAVLRHGVVGMPLAFGRSIVRDPGLDGIFSEARFFEVVGRQIVTLFDHLGPIYGKAGQVFLSRLSPEMHELAESLRLTRLYKDWPPLPFSEVAVILDREIPGWRKQLKVEAHPLGVASLGQVHAATDRDGKAWVLKIIKPDAKRRLLETVGAMEELITWLEPVAVTLVARRFCREVRELCQGFRRELSLTRERDTIGKVHEKLRARRQKVLVIPQVHPEFATDDVLVIERFDGVPMSSVVRGKAELPAAVRQKLAKSMLHELLVQVFELGLFHADPHAGNLMLLENGSVGLYDWGLAGELLDSDRRHIAAILRSVLLLDLDQLIDALIEMSADNGREISRESVRKELKNLIAMVKRAKENPEKKPSMQAMLEAALKAADRLGIRVPQGLLLMAKSLITIEGLAKGIDPQVSLGRVAAPVLLKAARPGLRDLMAMGMKIPELTRQFFVR
jgi:ubiquinone biosynthesis protein